MSDIDVTWYRVHLAAQTAAEAALIAYYLKAGNGYGADMHQNNAVKYITDAATHLGYDLVKREKEAA